jgi:hypothetical protein
VAYAHDGEDLVVYVGRAEGKQWWRNFEEPRAVQVRLRGADLAGVARATCSDRAARDAYEDRFARTARAIEREHMPVFVRIGDLQPANRH